MRHMNVALILSGGTGTRLGSDIPKQYIEAGGRPVIGYCISVLSAHEQIDALHIVADKSWHDLIGKVWKSRTEKGNLRDFPFRGKTGSFLFFMDWKISGNMQGTTDMY